MTAPPLFFLILPWMQGKRKKKVIVFLDSLWYHFNNGQEYPGNKRYGEGKGVTNK